MRKHYVTFLSPGSFVHETTTRPIDSWDTKAAVAMAETIEERYSAKPFAFEFSTVLSAPSVIVEGEVLQVREKTVATSGRYYLGGKVESFDEVDLRGAQHESVLRSNMRCNGWWYMITNTNSWRVTQPFDKDDMVVDATGAIIERGDSPERVAYRDQMTAKHKSKG